MINLESLLSDNDTDILLSEHSARAALRAIASDTEVYRKIDETLFNIIKDVLCTPLQLREGLKLRFTRVGAQTDKICVTVLMNNLDIRPPMSSFPGQYQPGGLFQPGSWPQRPNMGQAPGWGHPTGPADYRNTYPVVAQLHQLGQFFLTLNQTESDNTRVEDAGNATVSANSSVTQPEQPRGFHSEQSPYQPAMFAKLSAERADLAASLYLMRVETSTMLPVGDVPMTFFPKEFVSIRSLGYALQTSNGLFNQRKTVPLIWFSPKEGLRVQVGMDEAAGWASLRTVVIDLNTISLCLGKKVLQKVPFNADKINEIVNVIEEFLFTPVTPSDVDIAFQESI